jgi:hypothetical protein
VTSLEKWLLESFALLLIVGYLHQTSKHKALSSNPNIVKDRGAGMWLKW